MSTIHVGHSELRGCKFASDLEKVAEFLPTSLSRASL